MNEGISIRIGNVIYPSTLEATNAVKKILATLGPTESIRQKDESAFFLLLDLLKRHPEAIQKGFFHEIGESMIRDMTLINQSSDGLPCSLRDLRSVSLRLVLGVVIHPFGTPESKTIKVSWTKCIRPENDTYYYKLQEAMRYVVQETIEYFSSAYQKEGETHSKEQICEECSKTSWVRQFEVDYFKLLGLLANNYLHTKDLSQFPEDFDRCPETYWAIFREDDSLFRDHWIQFFADHARPRWLCLRCINKRHT